jgi:hypothetical protein
VVASPSGVVVVWPPLGGSISASFSVCFSFVFLARVREGFILLIKYSFALPSFVFPDGCLSSFNEHNYLFDSFLLVIDFLVR